MLQCPDWERCEIALGENNKKGKNQTTTTTRSRKNMHKWDSIIILWQVQESLRTGLNTVRAREFGTEVQSCAESLKGKLSHLLSK